MYPPKISICIPTYNRAKFLKTTIESAIQQNPPVSFEIVISDNASTDETSELVQSFQNDHIRYVKNPTNIGAFANFGRCSELAQGEFITFWTDDDVYDPNLINEQFQILSAHPEVGMVYCAHGLVDEHDNFLEQIYPFYDPHIWPGHKELKHLVRRNYIYSPLLRRNLFEQVGGFDPNSTFLDWDLWLRFCLKGNVAYIAKQMFTYRLHPTQTTINLYKNKFDMSMEKIKILDNLFVQDPDLHYLKNSAYAKIVQFECFDAMSALKSGHGQGVLLHLGRAWKVIRKSKFRSISYSIADAFYLLYKRLRGYPNIISFEK